jgi:acylphosphatase
MGYTTPKPIRAEIIVEGDVQGVGFRYYARRAARRLGIVGYVENLEDGNVKIICESPREKIEELIQRLEAAQPPIKVEKISLTYTEATGQFKSFKIVTGELAEEMVEGFSTGAAYFEVMFAKQDQLLSKQDQMLEKQDRMLEKQDKMLEKQDMMLEKQDRMLEKQDLMLEKQDSILSEIRGLRHDINLIFEERIARIERDVAAIKSRIGLTG